MDTIQRGKDGYYHPANEGELIALVKYANDSGIPLRVRGSQHSIVPSIYTTGYDGEGPPPAGVVEVMLNLYRNVTITPDPTDPAHADVVVEAGCNLGKNPYDPTHTSTWRNSLDYQLQAAGYALDDTGGISHQTISGFMSTGSSGGSLTYSFEDNLVGFSIIDAAGNVTTARRDDPATRDLFFAAGISMGLLGVISRVFLRVGRDFNVYGTQVTSKTAETGIDLFGGGDMTPALAEFFRRTPYTRLMWWPQRKLDRMSVWQAARTTPPKGGFVPQPYLEMGSDPQPEALAGSFFYTLIGNLGDVSVVPAKLKDWYIHLDEWLAGDPDPNACAPVLPNKRRKPTFDELLEILRAPIEKGLRDFAAAEPTTFAVVAGLAKALAPAIPGSPPAGPDLPQWIAALITVALALLIQGALDTTVAQGIADFLNRVMPWLITPILEIFITLGTQYFWESWRCGLPMDNQMDDQLWDTEFTELWIPLEKTQDVMDALATFYAGGGDAKTAYQHTGAFSCEIYAASASQMWMSPAYGKDVIRIDVFWFGLNAGSPVDQFYPQFWTLLKDFGYVPHWGKYLGPPENYLKNIPRLKDFLALRAQRDPKNIFLTDYWRAALGIG